MAAPVFDSAASGTATSGTTVSWTHTLNSGSGNDRVMIIYTSSQAGSGANNATGVTVDGVAATEQAGIETTANFLRVEQWYILDTDLPASSGSYTVEVTFAGSQSRAICGSVCYTEAAQEAPQTPEEVAAGDSATSMSDSITTTKDDSVIVGFLAHLAEEAHTPDTGQTERFDTTIAGENLAAAAGDETIATAGAESMGWSWSTSVRYAHLLTALNPGAIDETGKAITVTGAITETNTQSMSETAKSLTAVAVVSETDFKVQFETGLSFTAVASITGSHTYVHIETGSLVTMVGVLTEDNVMTMDETGKSFTMVGVLNSYLGAFVPTPKGGAAGSFIEQTPNSSGGFTRA